MWYSVNWLSDQGWTTREQIGDPLDARVQNLDSRSVHSKNISRGCYDHNVRQHCRYLQMHACTGDIRQCRDWPLTSRVNLMSRKLLLLKVHSWFFYLTYVDTIDLSRAVFSDIWPQTFSGWPMNQRPVKGSPEVKQILAIRKPVYDFLFDFYRHYLSIVYRFQENAGQNFKGYIFITEEFDLSRSRSSSGFFVLFWHEFNKRRRLTYRAMYHASKSAQLF